MKQAFLLAAALGVAGCAHPGNAVTASASYTNSSAAHGGFSLSGPGAAMVQSRRCVLGERHRTTVLAALARVEPEHDRDGDTEAFSGASAGSGLLIVFRKGASPAMTVMLQASPARRGQARSYVHINGRFGSIASDDLQKVQAAVRRSGCSMSMHRRSVA